MQTVGEVMSFWRGLEHVDVEYPGRNEIIFTNAGDGLIRGFTFAIAEVSVNTDDVQFKTRQVDGNDLLVWFDFSGGQRVKFMLGPLEKVNGRGDEPT